MTEMVEAPRGWYMLWNFLLVSYGLGVVLFACYRWGPLVVARGVAAGLEAWSAEQPLFKRTTISPTHHRVIAESVIGVVHGRDGAPMH